MTTHKEFATPGHLLDRATRILVIGCGGTGAEMVDALMRLHFVLRALAHPGLRLSVQDGDKVEEHNVGRQRFAPADIGMNKAEVLARRYGTIYNERIGYYPCYAKASHIAEFGSEFEVVVTCVDRARFRDQMGAYWSGRASRTLWLDCGNGSHSGQAILGHLGMMPADQARLPNVYDLYPSLAQVDDTAEPSCGSIEASIASQNLFVNRWSCDTAVSLLWQLYRFGKISAASAFFDMRALKVTPVPIDPAGWRFFGYDDATRTNVKRKSPKPATAGSGRRGSRKKA